MTHPQAQTQTQTRTPGLTVTHTPPSHTTGPVVSADVSPSELWVSIATTESFQARLVTAVRELIAHTHPSDRVQRLVDHGATVCQHGYARLLTGVDRPPESPYHEQALDLTTQFGTGEVTPLGHAPSLDQLTNGPLPVLEASSVVPQLTVTVPSSFQTRRRDQRDQICQLLSMLKTACDVRVVCSTLTAHWLAETHRETLPVGFRQACSSGRGQSQPQAAAPPIDVLTARFDPESRPVDILRRLADVPSQSLLYSELVGSVSVSASRVSQVLTELADSGLVERHGPQTDLQVDLLPAGAEFVAHLDDTVGRQSTLDTATPVNGGRQRSQRDVYAAPLKRGGSVPPSDIHGGGNSPQSIEEQRSPTVSTDNDSPSSDEESSSTRSQSRSPKHTPYRTRYLNRQTSTGIEAASVSGDIVPVEAPLMSSQETIAHSEESMPVEQKHTRFVSFNSTTETAIVSVYATTPLQYAVSLAVGLASPRFIDKALPPQKLTDLTDDSLVLRQIRCIGELSAEAAADGNHFRDRLIEKGKEIADMTTELSQANVEDREKHCRQILRHAHGLAGTIIHLLDAAEIDIVREVRLPSLTHTQLAPLCKTIAVSVAIQSEYTEFAAYRQLFETREQKRQSVPTPIVDSTDPVGNLIGSIVLRGPGASTAARHLDGHISSPRPLHDDAPEFAISVQITPTTRESYTRAVNKTVTRKDLKATPEAVSFLQATVTDLYAIPTALIRLTQSTVGPRTLRLDELRYALTTLPTTRLLKNCPPTAKQIFAALLTAQSPLTRTEIATQADISSRSVTRHLDALVETGLVRPSPSKAENATTQYTVCLPQSASDSRTTAHNIFPDTDTASRVDEHLFDVVCQVISTDQTGRLIDPTDPLGAAFCGPRTTSPEIRALRDALPSHTGLIPITVQLHTGKETQCFPPPVKTPNRDGTETPTPAQQTACSAQAVYEFGTRTNQQSVSKSAKS